MDIFWNDTLQVSSLKNNKILDASGQCYVQPCCNDKKMQNDVCLHYAVTLIAQFRYIKIQLETKDITTRLRGMIVGFIWFIPLSLAVMSFVSS